MARIGGRAMWIAVPAGVACAMVVGALAWLSMPMMPAVGTWLVDAGTGRLATPAAAPSDVAEGAEPADCRDLYSDALWAALTWTPDIQLTQDAAAPQTTATAFVQALGPTVALSCSWRAGEKTISTTYGQVATDAGAIAAAALPSEGFRCDEVAEGRIRCEKADGGNVETIEVGEGLWLSSLQTGWAPERYAGRVAERIWTG